MKRNKLKSELLRFFVYSASYLTISIVVLIISYILLSGIPNIKPSLFAFHYTSDNCSLFPAFINTIAVVFLSLVIGLPVGVFSAIYLTEYAKHGSKCVRFIRMMAETLSGIPSIVYGLFGYLFFNISLKLGYSILSGAITLSMMILPLIMRTSEEAIMSVPDPYREGSYGLGAGKIRTIFSIVLPSAAPGIFGGIMLAIGRIIGETAALVFTAGTVAGIPGSVMGSGRTLSVHMYVLMNEGLHMNEAKGVAVILLILVLILNSVSLYLQKRIKAK